MEEMIPQGVFKKNLGVTVRVAVRVRLNFPREGGGILFILPPGNMPRIITDRARDFSTLLTVGRHTRGVYQSLSMKYGIRVL